jgi:hypothetical protein
MLPLDEGLERAMDLVYELIKNDPRNEFSDDQIRMSVAAINFKQLVNVILIADDREDIQVNMTQLALGILATASWLSSTLPEELQG